MYYLTNFCRICVRTDAKLMDIDTVDFDEVRLSEKLEVCTKMGVTGENLSRKICKNCVSKLRISYQFQDMCRRSTNILQRYINQLKSGSKSEEDFASTELNVFLSPLNVNCAHETRKRKRRITKERRCSLLKKLLTTKEQVKERDKTSDFSHCRDGGLRNIINFTKNYEFTMLNTEQSHLERLQSFSRDFFRKDFTEFKNTVLCIIENREEFCDSDFGDSESEFESEEALKQSKTVVMYEEVVVEPDIKIKDELPDYEAEQTPIDLVETSLDNIKKEHQVEKPSADSPPTTSLQHNPNSMQFLDDFVRSYNVGKTFSPLNVRCRTRNNPYISPTLKEQFLYRSFRCEKCSRYFKSPGYLKAHHSKVH